MFCKTYSLRKSRKIMKAACHWHRKQSKKLSTDSLSVFESHLQLLDQALLEGDRTQADTYARKVENFCNQHFKKNLLMHGKELIVALTFALIVALVIRQMWFELYEIPTGSMRPTYQEKDLLTVSKTQFGLNKIMQPSHFLFDPDQIKRTGVMIFLGDNLPINDGTSYYFNLIPYSKRFIKRMIAKPGDTVYFYGGKIYAIDKDDQTLPELLTAPWMQPLEHIPILNYTGRTAVEGNRITLKQMDQPVGRLTVTPYGSKGEVFNGKKWITDRPTAKPHDKIQTYSDLWGIRNFAMARLLTPEQLQQHPELKTNDIGEGVLYLELSHHPTLNSRETALHTHKTVIPLQQKHVDALFDAIYTTRFVVENGRARNYTAGGSSFSKSDPSFPGVPDGTYQIDRGTVQEVHFGGVVTTVAEDHPLNKQSAKLIQKLYNLGIDFNIAYRPLATNPFPNRYVYFREGNLYILNQPIFTKDDPTLTAFNKRENERESKGGYIAFKDYGPPSDLNFIKTFGLKVPDGHYLVLGDNHAVSGDSRVMGFIPEENIRGVPDLLLWPPGSRWLTPESTPYPLLTTPRLIVWFIAATAGLIWFIIHQRNKKRPMFKKR